MQFMWPILLAVMADVIYQISAKSMPEKLNPFASLTITYLVGAVVSAVLFYVLSGRQSLLAEWKNINWTTFALGFAIVGLEAGSIYMYKVGWNLNTGYIVRSMILAIALIILGYVLYREQLSLNKVLGAALCLCGLILINR